MKKIGIVIHQYGDKIVGGAESYSKDLAEHLSDEYDVTVFTTTSIDYNTWKPYYKAGKEVINGVTVRRYDVEHEREMDKFSAICNRLVGKLQNGEATTVSEDEEWICAEGPYCPQMISDIEKEAQNYSLFIVVTYIYYLAVKAIPKVADKALFISTAHDEPWINMSMYKRIFHMPKYFGFLTDAEKELVRERFNNNYIPHEILGTGIQVPDSVDAARCKVKFNISGDYIVYVGRLDETKGCKELCEYFLEYSNRKQHNLKLVLVGKGDMHIPIHENIIATGFVSDEEKYDIISGALAMVTPSKYESLCIALLEGMALGIPIIANEKCSVLKQHCIKSNAGLYYDNIEDFINIIDYLITHPAEYNVMKNNGINYVKCNYTWDIVKVKIRRIINNISSELTDDINVNDYKVFVSEENTVSPAWNSDAITIVTAADNSYANYAGVTINSILKNMSLNDYYDILVFTNDMSDAKIAQIIELADGYRNVSIRFVYVNEIMDALDINISNNYKIVTYYRLLLQKTMEKYSKIIYMDSDVIINCNIAELWNTDMEGALLAGTYDCLIAAWQNYDSGMRSYFNSLALNEPGKYVQAGVIILNIEELNNTFKKTYLLEKACEEHYIFADQDLLNIACKGKVKYVDQSWDVLNLTDEGRDLAMKYLPTNLRNEMKTAELYPKAVHYVEQSFPFKKKSRKFSNLYWEYSYGTPFYEELKSIYLDNKNAFIDSIDKVGDKKTIFTRIKNYLNRNGIINNHSNKICENIKVDASVVSTKKEVVLQPNQVLSGPNIFLGAGNHKASISICEGLNSTIELFVYAGARHIVLAQKELTQNVEEVIFHTECNEIDVEIVIENKTNSNIVIKGIDLC